jgi:putative chitinase
MKLQDKYQTLFEKYGLTTKLRIAHFMAQIEHESGLKPISENLNYSADGLSKTFPKYFDKEQSLAYARQSEKIANRVYANRMGNGNEASGEGWKYRGRGFLQITGKENYFHLLIDTDLDVIRNPDLLLEEPSALWFWDIKGLNKIADKNDIITITKRINGGLNGIEHRKELLKKYML